MGMRREGAVMVDRIRTNSIFRRVRGPSSGQDSCASTSPLFAESDSAISQRYSGPFDSPPPVTGREGGGGAGWRESGGNPFSGPNWGDRPYLILPPSSPPHFSRRPHCCQRFDRGGVRPGCQAVDLAFDQVDARCGGALGASCGIFPVSLRTRLWNSSEPPSPSFL